jgi:hypothetical protein
MSCSQPGVQPAQGSVQLMQLAFLQGTWPTGIKAPLMDRGPFECLDFVYVWAAPQHDVR